MKALQGGVMAPPPGSIYGQCSSTATCQNGTTITLACEGWDVSCTGIDYGSPNGGWTPSSGQVYCASGFLNNRGLLSRSCLTPNY